MQRQTCLATLHKCAALRLAAVTMAYVLCVIMTHHVTQLVAVMSKVTPAQGPGKFGCPNVTTAVPATTVTTTTLNPPSPRDVCIQLYLSSVRLVSVSACMCVFTLCLHCRTAPIPPLTHSLCVALSAAFLLAHRYPASSHVTPTKSLSCTWSCGPSPTAPARCSAVSMLTMPPALQPTPTRSATLCLHSAVSPCHVML